MRNTFLISFFMFVATLKMAGQTSSIQGTVYDAMSNKPLPFVNVIIHNSQIGTTTDTLGGFTFNNLSGDFIQIQLSSIGYDPLLSEVISLSKVHIISISLSMRPANQSLTEITVNASRFANKPESPLGLQRIGIDLIERSAGANRDISKVFQSLPGVGSVKSFRNDLIVRGGGPSENKFYVEGVEIPTLNHFSTQGASGGPVGIINVDFVREADFYTGAFPVSRGNALSSVFDLRLIDANKDKASYKASIGASDIAFSANAPLSKKTGLTASIRRSYLQFLFKQLQLPFLPTYNDFQFKTKTRINQKNELTLIGLGAYDQFQLNTSAPETEESKYILSYLPVNNQWNYALGGVYKHFFSESVVTTILSRNHLNNEAYKYQDNIELPQNLIYKYNSQEIENKFRSEIQSQMGLWSLNAGIGFEQANYTNDSYNKLFENDQIIEKTKNSDLSFYKWATFANVSRKFGDDKLQLSAGVRMDANSYSSQMSNLLDQLSPRISASWSFAKNWFFNTSAAKYYQLPAYTTLGYQVNNSYVNKNNGIKYISANHYLAGIEYRPSNNLKISVEGFMKDYNNYSLSLTDSVSLASKGGDFGVFGDEEVIPTSSGKTSGLEFLIRYQNTKNNLILAYTLFQSQFTNWNNQHIASSWDSKHLVSLTFNRNFKNNWNLGGRWRYVGGLPYTPADINKSSLKEAWDINGREYLNYNAFNSLRLGAFHQLDIRVDKSYYFKKWSLAIYIDIQNLYNSKSDEATKYFPETNELGNLVIVNPTAPASEQRYNLNELKTTSGTVLPTIGIIVEF